MNKILIPSRKDPVEFTVLGEAASKANSRKIVSIKGKVRSIKSDKARAFVEAFTWQCPLLNPLFTGDVHVEATIFYASRRPDLDESIVLDAMQGRIYVNDRQVKKKTIEWGIDRGNPRIHLRISPYV